MSDSGSEKDHQFGIYLGSGKDCNGCLVPQILIDFHKFLTSNNAFHTEGIFRITGCTKLVENILKELSGPPSSYVYGGSLYEWQIHEVSSLIKVCTLFFILRYILNIFITLYYRDGLCQCQVDYFQVLLMLN